MHACPAMCWPLGTPPLPITLRLSPCKSVQRCARAQAWTEFDDAGRMRASSLRARVVDVAEELYKFSLLLRGHSALLTDRYSERAERAKTGRLLSQAEKEALRTKDAAATG